MPAILAKKLGMTQLFLEDGRVERVTVLEAGPCPVTGDPHARARRLRGRAARVRRDARRSTSPSPSSATSRRPTPRRPCATSSSSATRPASCRSATPSPSRPSRPARQVKVAGTSKGKGFQGTIKRHNFASGPEVARLAQRARPGLDRRVRLARPRDEGHPRPRPDGQQARHPEGPRDRRGRRRARTCCSSAAPSPARATASWRCAPMPKRSRSSAAQQDRHARRRGLRRARSTARSCTSRCARSSTRAARARTSTKTRGEVRGGGAKPWRQKGTGRARAGSSRSPIWTGGGIVFGPPPRHYTFKVNRKERRAALRSALSVHAERGSLAILDPAPFATRRRPSRPPRCSPTGATAARCWSCSPTSRSASALSFRNLDARRACCPADGVGVADVHRRRVAAGHARTALDELTARANGERDDDARRRR